MTHPRIAIVSLPDDLHALAIQQALRAAGDTICDLIPSNRLCGSDALAWACGAGDRLPPTLPVTDGDRVPVDELDLLWWRRVDFPQEHPPHLTEPAHLDLINNDCGAALLGVLMTEFRGTWVSHPTATRLAENKLVQLRAARQAGLRIPDTLVSQDPTEIRRFCARHAGRVIIKPVRGTHLAYVYTQQITETTLASDEALRLAPAIYQELIAGTRHLRVLCLGDEVHAAQIESDALDWRGNLDIPSAAARLDDDTCRRLREVLRLLDLRMGVFDLKLTDAGEVVWLEVNPQGQFLFVEGMSGLDLTGPFTAFLRREALRASQSRTRSLSPT